jgi:hypothetical protein
LPAFLLALFGEQRSRARRWGSDDRASIMADHERAAHFDGLRMRKASIVRAFDSYIERNRLTPASATALNRTVCPYAIFWGHLRIDLAGI